MKRVAMALAVVLAFSCPAWSLTIAEVGVEDQLNFGLNLANSGQQLQDLGYIEVENNAGDYWVDVEGEGGGEDLWAYFFSGSEPTSFVVKTGEDTYNENLVPEGEYNAFFYTNLTNLQYAVININDYYFTTGGGSGGPKEKGIEISRISHVNTNAVPEPGTLLLLGSGLLVVGLMRLRRN